jgi:hypothetical protein
MHPQHDLLAGPPAPNGMAAMQNDDMHGLYGPDGVGMAGPMLDEAHDAQARMQLSALSLDLFHSLPQGGGLGAESSAHSLPLPSGLSGLERDPDGAFGFASMSTDDPRGSLPLTSTAFFLSSGPESPTTALPFAAPATAGEPQPATTFARMYSASDMDVAGAGEGPPPALSLPPLSLAAPTSQVCVGFAGM